jgi:hypothetical protein
MTTERCAGFFKVILFDINGSSQSFILRHKTTIPGQYLSLTIISLYLVNNLIDWLIAEN